MISPDCYFGDHNDVNGHCTSCGSINFRLLGWFGARARWAKAWGITEEEVEARWNNAAEEELGEDYG